MYIYMYMFIHTYSYIHINNTTTPFSTYALLRYNPRYQKQKNINLKWFDACRIYYPPLLAHPHGAPKQLTTAQGDHSDV